MMIKRRLVYFFGLENDAVGIDEHLVDKMRENKVNLLMTMILRDRLEELTCFCLKFTKREWLLMCEWIVIALLAM